MQEKKTNLIKLGFSASNFNFTEDSDFKRCSSFWILIYPCLRSQWSIGDSGSNFVWHWWRLNSVFIALQSECPHTITWLIFPRFTANSNAAGSVVTETSYPEIPKKLR